MTFSELQPKGAGVRRHPSVPLFMAASALALTGCAAGPQYSAEPRDDLAGQAQVQQSATESAKPEPHGRHRHRPGQSASPSATASSDAAPGGTTGASGNGGSNGSGGAVAAPPPAGWTRAASLGDPTGDLGLSGGPSYADVVGVAVDDNGSTARFTVTVAGQLPTGLPTGEVEGIGLDIFRGGGTESDYQLFLDGGDGWRVFLQTPRGFTRFPGTFTLGDRTLTVDVPWSSIGGHDSFDLGLFADWSREGGLVNSSSQDSAPDRGTTRVVIG